jgi:hypothetical protein
LGRFSLKAFSEEKNYFSGLKNSTQHRCVTHLYFLSTIQRSKGYKKETHPVKFIYINSSNTSLTG